MDNKHINLDSFANKLYEEVIANDIEGYDEDRMVELFTKYKDHLSGKTQLDDGFILFFKDNSVLKVIFTEDDVDLLVGQYIPGDGPLTETHDYIHPQHKTVN